VVRGIADALEDQQERRQHDARAHRRYRFEFSERLRAGRSSIAAG
jgi:hypothetical protein